MIFFLLFYRIAHVHISIRWHMGKSDEDQKIGFVREGDCATGHVKSNPRKVVSLASD